MKRIINRIIKRFTKHVPNAESADPFAELEAKGLKIADSSKKRMHSPWGIDRMFPWLIEIGEECIISTNVVILSHDASPALTNGITKMGRVRIGDHVFIGQGTTVLCGVTIGDNVIIGANSLVSRDVPSNSVFAGNPARFVCTFDEYRKKRETEKENVPFLEHDWIYWSSKASPEEQDRIRDLLSETGICYIKSNYEPVGGSSK
ncbi:MAG: acyltransferase [Clostridia bacterium]|nr:acyltransferase [Clostridia bacterium]